MFWKWIWMHLTNTISYIVTAWKKWISITMALSRYGGTYKSSETGCKSSLEFTDSTETNSVTGLWSLTKNSTLFLAFARRFLCFSIGGTIPAFPLIKLSGIIYIPEEKCLMAEMRLISVCGTRKPKAPNAAFHQKTKIHSSFPAVRFLTLFFVRAVCRHHT